MADRIEIFVIRKMNGGGEQEKMELLSMLDPKKRIKDLF